VASFEYLDFFSDRGRPILMGPIAEFPSPLPASRLDSPLHNNQSKAAYAFFAESQFLQQQHQQLEKGKNVFSPTVSQGLWVFDGTTNLQSANSVSPSSHPVSHPPLKTTCKVPRYVCPCKLKIPPRTRPLLW